MGIINKLKQFKYRNYCPKCGIKMKKNKVRSNSEEYEGKIMYICMNCKGFKFK